MEQSSQKNIHRVRHGWRIFAIAMMTLLAVGAGWLYADAQTARHNEQVATARIAALSSQVNELSGKQREAPVATPQKTDKEQVAAVVTAYAHAYKAWDKSSIAVDTSNVKETTDVALVPFTATNPNGSLGCIVKKIAADDTWVVLNCGQGLPGQTVLDDFGIPSNFTQSNGAN